MEIHNIEKDRLRYSIQRFDQFYDSVNNKCAVFLGLSTFIVGGLIATYPSFVEKIEATAWVNVFMGLLIGVGILNMLITVRASTPFLSRGKDSLYYYGAISCLKLDQFERQSAGCNEEEELGDLRAQAHQLAIGLEGKFRKLRWSGHLFTLQFLLLIPTVALLLLNLK